MKKEKDIKQYLPQLHQTRLFKNMDDEEIIQSIDYLNGSIYTYKKDEMILSLGSIFAYAGVIIDGTVEGSFINETYQKINMNHFPKGSMFGEAFGLLQTKHSPVELKALSTCTILQLNLHTLYKEKDLPEVFQQKLSLNLMQTLASQNIFINLKLRISNQKNIRDRILMYLNSLIPNEKGYVHIPFTQTAWLNF